MKTHTQTVPSQMSCLLLATALAATSLLAHAQTSVPYIGCPGDGQTGPYAAAKGSSKPVNLALAVADQLAWYEYNGDAGHFGTLGPRGWNCFVTIGSNGWTLYIAPEPLNSAKLPAHRDYARSIIDEGFGPASEYPFGPFQSDHLSYKGKDLVEFTTPAHRDGLGTMSWLLPSDHPSDLMSTRDFYT